MGIKVSAHLTFIFWSIKTFVKKHQKLILGSKAAFDINLYHDLVLRLLNQDHFMVYTPPQ